MTVQIPGPPPSAERPSLSPTINTLSKPDIRPGMPIRSSSARVPAKNLSFKPSRAARREQRSSLSPSALQNLSLDSRTPPTSHAISSFSQPGSPVMTATYLSHPTFFGAAPGQLHMMAARIAAKSPRHGETGFDADPCFQGNLYGNSSTFNDQPSANNVEAFRYEVTHSSTNYDQPSLNFSSRPGLLDYGIPGTPPVYSMPTYGSALHAMHCTEAMDIRSTPLASSHGFDSPELAMHQIHFHDNSHLPSGPADSPVHHSPHSSFRQSPSLADSFASLASQNYARSISSNLSNSVDIPTSSLGDQYSSTLSSMPVLPSSQAYEPPPYFANGSLPETSYSVSSPTPLRALSDPASGAGIQVRVVNSRTKPQCWDHGCNGREFSTFSNLLRHQREKAGLAAKSECPYCGTVFTRTTARNGHLTQGKCKVKRQLEEKERAMASLP